MVYNKFNNKLLLDRSIVKNTGFNPYYCRIQSALDDPLMIEDKEFINLAANNYLGIANDKRVKKAMRDAVDKYGASLCGTPIATGYIDLYEKVERKISGFLGLEASIILPSCYQANNGLFSSIADKDDLIIIDHFAHSSLIQGIKNVGCKIKPFLHNNMDSLNKILKNSVGYNNIFVVTESVFSTEGSIAPFKEIVDLCDMYGALPVIDDSHGIGVIGGSGKGILEYQGIKNYQGIYTASLGKAFGVAGGIISGKVNLIEYLKYYCAHLVYSTAVVPAILGGLDRGIEIIQEEFHSLSKIMWEYKFKIAGHLQYLGYNICNSEAPITSIKSGNSENTFILAKKFYDNNILATPFIEPSVPPNNCRIRLIAGANLKEESIDKALGVFSKIIKNNDTKRMVKF